MGEQIGILPIAGTIDNITFYKSGDGYMVRKKGGVDARRIATDPAFERTRENWAEFAKAGAACKVLRRAFTGLLKNSADKRMTSRLAKQMMKVIKADASSSRGMRNVLDGEVELLQGFDFNINGLLDKTLAIDIVATIDRAAGTLSVELPSFIPADKVAFPNGATHFKIVSSGSEINFEKGLTTTSNQATDVLPLDDKDSAPIKLTSNVTANSTYPLILVAGVEFFQDVNGKIYPLRNGSFNALKIVQVSGM